MIRIIQRIILVFVLTLIWILSISSLDSPASLIFGGIWTVIVVFLYYAMNESEVWP